MLFLHEQPTLKNLSLLFLIALLIRAAVFFFYVQHNERYHQADSADYHSCAFLLAYSNSLIRPDNDEPIFWRTPGYPVYLWPFYYLNGVTAPEFNDYAWAHKASIWVQIIVCSFIPIILFYLALLLTSSLIIAWLIAWITVFHIGFILACTYLLTDALASIFFYLFLLFYYQSWNMYGQKLNKKSAHSSYKYLLLSVLFLSLYTWTRPMGIFIAIFAALLLIVSNDLVVTKLKKIFLFLSTFFLCVLPWYIRNYYLTGKFFFCPMFGGVLQAFCAPKIVRRITGYPLRDCLKALFLQVKQQAAIEKQIMQEQGLDLHVVEHHVCEQVALPWIMEFPGYALYDWIEQVFKATFDLYSYQLVMFATNTFMYDPIEEYLHEKIAACLYAVPLPWWMRTICWAEFIFYIIIWTGFFIGLWKYAIKPLYNFVVHKQHLINQNFMWFKTIPMIGAALIMTGGYGYARLRIPIEPLIIILALSYWFYTDKKMETST